MTLQPGRTISNLTLQEKFVEVKTSPSRSRKVNYWNCLCSCGKKTRVREDHLKSGATTSCGCRREKSTWHLC